MNQATTSTLMLLVVMATAGLGCTKDRARAEASRQDKAALHAKEGAKPGTYEDWCDEHQVPESQCTQCNASLGAAFKATGDWCDEHGLPESHCRKCNPELKIVRPPKIAEK